MQAHEIIYRAKDQILRNRKDILAASLRRETEKVLKLQQENDRIRKAVFRDFAVLIDY